MALILQKKSSFRRWYEKNRERLSEKRKRLYAEDLEYRERALESSRRYRRGEPTLTSPPEEAPISFGEVAKRIGIAGSTLSSWRKKKFFPDPRLHNGRLWFSEKQILLLTNLRKVIRVYGKRRGKVKRERLNEVVASIGANWD